jgi:hypothetical protein
MHAVIQQEGELIEGDFKTLDGLTVLWQESDGPMPETLLAQLQGSIKNFQLFRDTMSDNTEWLDLCNGDGVGGLLARYVGDGDVTNAAKMYAYLDGRGLVSESLKGAIQVAALAAGLGEEFQIVTGG